MGSFVGRHLSQMDGWARGEWEAGVEGKGKIKGLSLCNENIFHLIVLPWKPLGNAPRVSKIS